MVRALFDEKLSKYLAFFISIIVTFLVEMTKLLSLHAESSRDIASRLQFDQLPLYRAFALLALLAGMGYWSAHFNPYKIREILWWMPKGSRTPTKNQTWEQIIGLLSLSDCNDPITRAKMRCAEPATAQDWLNFLTAVLLLSCGLSIALDYILFPRVPGLFVFPAGDPAERDAHLVNIGNIAQLSNNLTAYLAIITAGIALYVAQFTIRAQVRSKSRQDWIDKMRDLTADIFSCIVKQFESSNKTESGDTTNSDGVKEISVLKMQMHLELLLNPSEKDHRLLMLLVRRCLSPEHEIKQDIFLKAELKKVFDGASLQIDPSEKIILRDILGIDRGKDAIIPANRLDAISYIVRLTNIILKREWMRVRDAK